MGAIVGALGGPAGVVLGAALGAILGSFFDKERITAEERMLADPYFQLKYFSNVMELGDE
jgi:hypothetical protein